MKLISNKDYRELLETIDYQKSRIGDLHMKVFELMREVAERKSQIADLRLKVHSLECEVASLKAGRLADPEIPEDRIEPYE